MSESVERSVTMPTSSDIWVSELNARAEIRSAFPRSTVRFYDTTLRDGEQTVGVVWSPQQKLDIARKLEELGISRIEAGFPRVSPQDTEAIRLLATSGLRSELWGFSRAVTADLQALIQLGLKASIIEAPTSDIKLKAYGIAREEVLHRVVEAVSFAQRNGVRVAFFAVDGTRTELEFLKTIYLAALDAGASELVVADTVGGCGPEAVQYLVSQVCGWVGPQVPVHFHGHNDFGMATACAIAAVRAGASWIQGTINGMGERAGNADIAEVGLALRCLYGVAVEIDLKKARETSREVSQQAGYTLDAWKPLVGDNLFTRESGAVASQFHIPEAIEPYSSELVAAQRTIVLGKKSGLDSIDWKARQLGLDLAQHQRAEILAAVKQLGTAKRGLLTDDEFRQIVAQSAAR